MGIAMSDEIVQAAREWIGVRWAHLGRNKYGLDCVGLIIKAGEGAGARVVDIDVYPRRPDGTLITRFRRQGIETPVKDSRVGDVLVFTMGRAPCHAGVLAWHEGRYTVIHAHAHRRKVMEEPLWAVENLAGSPSHCFRYIWDS